MEEILDKLITEIKLDQRYIDYVEAEKKLHNQEIDSLLHEYQNKLNQYDELKNIINILIIRRLKMKFVI